MKLCVIILLLKNIVTYVNLSHLLPAAGNEHLAFISSSSRLYYFNYVTVTCVCYVASLSTWRERLLTVNAHAHIIARFLKRLAKVYTRLCLANGRHQGTNIDEGQLLCRLVSPSSGPNKWRLNRKLQAERGKRGAKQTTYPQPLGLWTAVPEPRALRTVVL